jgi:hypothetical protein
MINVQMRSVVFRYWWINFNVFFQFENACKFLHYFKVFVWYGIVQAVYSDDAYLKNIMFRTKFDWLKIMIQPTEK